MNYQFLAMIVGFITVVFTILNQGHQLRTEIKETKTELKAEIDRVEDKLSAEINKLDTKIEKVEERLLTEIDRVEDKLSSEIKATNAKLDTFLLALFKGSIQLPKQNDKDAA